MSKHRRAKRGRTQFLKQPIGASRFSMAEFYTEHRRLVPTCTYGNKPHFVPPCFGDVGFFMCDPPADIKNHTRCRPPFDHEHADHFTWPEAIP